MIISFDEAKHQYTNEKGEIIPSVTQILGAVYGTGLENAPEYLVEQAAQKGTKVHQEIEAFLKGGTLGQTPEFNAWLNWWKLTQKENWESEKIVFAQTPNGAFAGTVDFWWNGWIYDWKTSKTATKAQVKKWQMQLSFYAYAMRQMGYIINEPLRIVHLNVHYEFINVPYLGDDFVEETMRLYKSGNKEKMPNKNPFGMTPEIKSHAEKSLFSISTTDTALETVSPKDLQTLEDVLLQMSALEKVAESYREKIKEEMERRGILQVQAGRVKLTYVPGTIRQSFDTKAFKKDDPDLYAIYLKDMEVKPSLRITVK